MSIFKNPADEEALCHALKAFVEEYGPEHVTVKVPQVWRHSTEAQSLGLVTLEYVTANTVEIHVNYCGQHIMKEVQLSMV